MEWQHSKIRSKYLDMQDLLVWAPAACISNEICEGRCCASSPSEFSLTPRAAEKETGGLTSVPGRNANGRRQLRC